MKNRLILVEGIPGSGKTTISKKIRDFLVHKGFEVELYSEGDVHPADMAWNALLTRDEYDNLIKENKSYERIIKENSSFENDYVIVAYTKLGLHRKENKLIDFLEAHEIYDGRANLDFFKEIHLKRWNNFCEKMQMDKNKIVIFECAFFQNHVNELLAVYEKNFSFIKEHLNMLIETVTELNPKLIYLNQVSINETIDRIAKQRVSNNKDKYPDWIDMAIEYYKNSNYGKHNNISGIDGIINFFKIRQEFELEILKSLPIDNLVIHNKDYNYDYIENTILSNL